MTQQSVDTQYSNRYPLDLQVKYPENFFLLRGNHECASINRIYGFYDECKRRYNIRLWKTFTDCFNCLPVAALVDEKVRCTLECTASSHDSCQPCFELQSQVMASTSSCQHLQLLQRSAGTVHSFCCTCLHMLCTLLIVL